MRVISQPLHLTQMMILCLILSDTNEKKDITSADIKVHHKIDLKMLTSIRKAENIFKNCVYDILMYSPWIETDIGKTRLVTTDIDTGNNLPIS